MANEKTCKHPACSCQARSQDPFCSDACKNAGAGDLCRCGHPGCDSGG